jgi:hypothetical protein
MTNHSVIDARVEKIAVGYNIKNLKIKGEVLAVPGWQAQARFLEFWGAS